MKAGRRTRVLLIYLLTVVVIFGVATVLAAYRAFPLPGPDCDPSMQFYVWVFLAFLPGVLAHPGLLIFRRTMGLRNPALANAATADSWGHPLRVAVVVLGTVGGAAILGAGLIGVAGLFFMDTNRWFVWPLANLGLVLLASGYWPYVIARSFPWNFPGKGAFN